MTGIRTAGPVAVVRPALPRTPFAAELAGWLHEGLADRPTGDALAARTRLAVVIVPEYLRAAPRPLLADLAAGRWAGRTVGLVGYAGRTRARHALAAARAALHEGGARVIAPALGVDVARVRAAGFDAADVVLRDLLLDELLLDELLA